MSGGVIIVMVGEVMVVGRDDGVGFVFFYVLVILLINVGVVSVGKNDIIEFFEGLELVIMGNGGVNLFGIGGDGEESFGFDVVVEGIVGDGGGVGYIFV